MIAAGSESVESKRCAEDFAASARLACKGLIGHVDGTSKKKRDEEPVAEAWLADALTEATAAGRCDLEPLSEVLRELAPLRQALSATVHSALVRPLESFVADADKVALEKKKYEASRDKLESARERYITQKGYNEETAQSLDDARAAVREQRANLTMVVTNEAAKRDTLLLRVAADAADAFLAYTRSAAELAERFSAVAAALRAKADQSKGAGDKLVMAAAAAVKTHASSPDPAGSAVADADPSAARSAGTGRSAEDTIAATSAAGRPRVVRQGYLMKPAKASLMGSGWRKRWVVLTAGTISYVNDKHVIAAEVKALQADQAVRVKEKIPLGFDAPPRVASEEDEVLRKENAQFNLQVCRRPGVPRVPSE